MRTRRPGRVAAGATLIGVNQRDLYSFEVDTDRAVRVARMLPDGVIRVAESGIRDGDDVRRLGDAGFDAVLVGEALVASPDPAAAVRALRSGARSRAGAVMFIKVCGTTCEDDALLAVALGADAVGFVFAPSPRQIAPQIAGDIVKRLPPEIVTVGVFQDEPPERVLEHRPRGRAAGRAAARPGAGRRPPGGSALACPWSSRPFRPATPGWAGPGSTRLTWCCSTRPTRDRGRCSTGRWPPSCPPASG